MVGEKRGKPMMNMMEINGYRAVVQYDPDIDMFRGEYVGLNGGADFYAKDIEGLRKEGEISLRVFLDMCRRRCRATQGVFGPVQPSCFAPVTCRGGGEGSSGGEKPKPMGGGCSE